MRRKALKAAFPCTIPIMTGFIFLGTAYGIYMNASGFSFVYPLFMSMLIYGGSLEFVAVEMLLSPFAPLQVFIMALLIQARHLFYGLSMLKPFERMGKRKPYMIFSLTDETYSLLCGVSAPEGIDSDWFLFFISLLDQLYWIIGSCVGAAASFLPFDSTGIDFAMTALFLVIFVEQWEKANSKLPALLGLGITLVSLIVVGPDRFLLFSMAGILAALLLFRKEISK